MYQNLFEGKEMKSSKMVAKGRATTLEMENKGWLSKKKVITKHRKVSRNNFQLQIAFFIN